MPPPSGPDPVRDAPSWRITSQIHEVRVPSPTRRTLRTAGYGRPTKSPRQGPPIPPPSTADARTSSAVFLIHLAAR